MLITFDLDGVLMENPFSKGVFPEIKEILYKQYNKQIISKNKNKSEEEIKSLIWQNILAEYKKYSAKNFYKAYDWDMIVKNVIDKLNLKVNIDVAFLVEKYCHNPYIKRYTDGVNLLKKLNNQNYKLKVVTNGYYKYQYPVLNNLELSPYFSEIVTCDKAESAKPEKEIFLKALEKYNSKNWIHIGDSVLMDVYGTNKLKGNSVLIDRNLPEDIASIEIKQRVKRDITKEYILKTGKKEKQFNNINFEENEIYPDYIVNTLDDIMKILC